MGISVLFPAPQKSNFYPASLRTLCRVVHIIGFWLCPLPCTEGSFWAPCSRPGRLVIFYSLRLFNIFNCCQKNEPPNANFIPPKYKKTIILIFWVCWLASHFDISKNNLFFGDIEMSRQPTNSKNWNYNFLKHLFFYMDKTSLKIDIKKEYIIGAFTVLCIILIVYLYNY